MIGGDTFKIIPKQLQSIPAFSARANPVFLAPTTSHAVSLSVRLCKKSEKSSMKLIFFNLPLSALKLL